MIIFDDITKESIKEHYPNWLQIPDHPYRILIVGGCGSGKTSALLHLISHQPNIGIYVYAKDPHEPKYQLLINKCESANIKNFNDFEAFIEYFFKDVEEFNPNKKQKH